MGALPVPIITVQIKPGTFGHCSVAKVWKRSEEHTYELNIAAEILNYPIEETLDTMLHEMVHLYCRENGIKEVSRGGRYHNGKFKEEAEKRGLECFQCGSAGWNIRPTDRLVEYALNKGWNEIRIGRNNLPPAMRTGAAGAAQGGAPGTEGGKRPSSTRKLVCPKCGQSVRATKAVHIICGECMERIKPPSKQVGGFHQPAKIQNSRKENQVKENSLYFRLPFNRGRNKTSEVPSKTQAHANGQRDCK